MQEKILKMYIMMQLKMAGLIEEFREEERGDANMVAVVLLIVIVIAVAVVFRETITQVAETVMGRLSEFVGE